MYYIDTLKQEFTTAEIYEHNSLHKRSVVDRYRCHMAAKFGVFVDEDHNKLSMLYWLHKLQKYHISNVLLRILVHLPLLICL